MGEVRGIGGYFLRATDPAGLTAWYRDHLGITTVGDEPWQQEAGPTVLAFVDRDADVFGGPAQQAMLNLRVSGLDTLLARLRDAGAAVDPEVQQMDGVGRFGWVTDPEGNRIELWEPA